MALRSAYAGRYTSRYLPWKRLHIVDARHMSSWSFTKSMVSGTGWATCMPLHASTIRRPWCTARLLLPSSRPCGACGGPCGPMATGASRPNTTGGTAVASSPSPRCFAACTRSWRRPTVRRTLPSPQRSRRRRNGCWFLLAACMTPTKLCNRRYFSNSTMRFC